MSEVTRFENSFSPDSPEEPNAAEQLLPQVYDELRRMAAAKMACASDGHTLQPTALVHEAWMRLNSSGEERSWNGKAHFFNAAAEAIRHILIDHARRKSRLKNGGNQQRVDIGEFDLCVESPDDRILLINENLEILEREHPERAKVVVLKFFGGMTNKEAADAMRISERSVNRHWICARTWLFNRIRAQS